MLRGSLGYFSYVCLTGSSITIGKEKEMKVNVTQKSRIKKTKEIASGQIINLGDS